MISFDEYDLNIILFNDIFYNIQFNTINEISSFSLPPVKHYVELNSDIKRILLHFIIKESCDTISNINKKNKVLVINELDDYEIFNYLERDKVIKFIKDSFKSLKNKFPFPSYILEDEIDFNNMTGELEDVLHDLHKEVDNYSTKSKTSRRLRGYSSQKGLKYLTDSYLVSGEFKKLLYK